MSTSTRLWFSGLVAAFISAFSTAASGALALPTVFNLSKPGLFNMLKLSVVPAALAVFAYLKQSPLPASMLGPGDTAVLKNPVVTEGMVTADSAVVTKATIPSK